eukprot:4248079-Prymnesium_polylepis.1
MSPLHGRHPWVPASWGGRITRSSPYSEPVGITPTAPNGREYYTRVSHIPPQQYRTVVEKRITPRSLVCRPASRWRSLRSRHQSFEGTPEATWDCASQGAPHLATVLAPGQRCLAPRDAAHDRLRLT